MNVNYLTDSRGNRIAVQIPFREWSELIAEYQKLKQYYTLKSNLQEAFREIEAIEKGETTPTTLSEFLNEC